MRFFKAKRNINQAGDSKSVSSIKQLISDVSNLSIAFEPLLFRAKILASSLNNPAFSEWIESELNGYNGKELPNYRILRCKVFGTYRNMVYQQSGVQIPLEHLQDKEVKEMFETQIMPHGIAELERMSHGGDDLRISLDTIVVQYLNHALSAAGGGQLLEAYHPMPSHIFAGIISTARSRFLDFLIAVKRESGDIELDAVEIDGEEVQRIFNVSIQGDNNTIVAGNRNTVSNKNIVNKGDWESLAKALCAEGVSDSEIEGLKEATNADEKNGEPFGQRSKEWLSKMCSNALSGIGKISFPVASRTLYNLIAAHSGLPPMP
jgi:AbiTii